MDKQKLLIVSDTPTLRTGLGRITREITSRCTQFYDVAVGGWHHLPLLRHSYDYYIYPLDKVPRDQGNQLAAVLQDFNPDILLAIGDIWDFFYAESIITQYRDQVKPLKAFLWLTVDGEYLNPGWGDILRTFDGVATFSHSGLEEIKKYKIKNNYSVIYPGLDKNTFFPYPKDFKWKKESVIEVEKTFMCLVVGQNSERKNMPATLEAFAEFQRDKSDVLLFMVTDPREPFGHDLWTIVKKLEIGSKVMVAKNAHPRSGIPEIKLNLLYNMATCIVNTAVGEGCGLPLLEAQAVNCVPMCVNYASSPEIVQDRGRVFDIGAMIYGEYGVKRAIVSQKSVVSNLNDLYKSWKGDRSLIKEYNKKGIAFASNFSWEKTVEELHTFMEAPSISDNTRGWVKEKIKLEHLKLMMVVPSWGKNCGIAEYSKELMAAIEFNKKETMVFPSNDPTAIVAAAKENKCNCVCLQHEFVFFQDRFALEQLLITLKKENIKSVVELHTYSPLANYNQMVLEHADEVIVHCDKFKESMTKGKEVEHLRILPMGCKPPVSFDLVEIKKELKLENKFPIVGSFGFMRDQKGYHDIAKAIRELRDIYKDIFFLLVAPRHEFGSSAYEETFYRFIEDLQLQDRALIIREYMPEEKLLKTLACADMFILNYKPSPAGGGNSAAVKTLMRAQRPIAVSDTLYFADLPGTVVCKLKTTTVDSLKGVIKELVDNKKKSAEYVKNANKYLNNNLWNNVAAKHIAIYS